MKLEKRVQIVLPVRLHKQGKPAHLWETACTYDISAGGARLTGMHEDYALDEIVTLERGKYRANFRVAWVGAKGTPLHTQMGVQLIEPDKQIWDVDLSALQEQYEPLPQPATGVSDQVDIALWPGAAYVRLFVGSEEFQGELIQFSMTDCTIQLGSNVPVRCSSARLLIAGEGFDLRLRGTVRAAASAYVIVDLEEVRRGDRRVLDYILSLKQKECTTAQVDVVGV